MELKEQFEKAAIDSKHLASKPDNEILLQLYALYKQGLHGDVTEDAPTNPFDFVGKAKHDAWHSLKGKPKDAAMTEYIALVTKLKG